MIDGHTRVCGVIGNPVEHTLSPLIHNHLAARLEDNLAYLPFRVQNEAVEEAIDGAFALNFLGLNVTVPHKSAVIPCLVEIDELAAKIGAVNTLVRQENGYKGYNTDMPGLYRAFMRDGIQIEGEEVLILGAGGVARAVALLLATKGTKRIVILNRTLDKARAIAEEVNAYAGRELVSVLALSEYRQLKGRKYLVIQATSVGMHPDTEHAVVEEADFYEMVHTGYDLIYNPRNTHFMQLVRAQGGKAFNGAGMLLYQGIIAYELWTGRTVSDSLADEIYEKMMQALENRK